MRYSYLEDPNRAYPKVLVLIFIASGCFGVTDLINRIVQILKQDLKQVKISTQNAELMEPVKP